MNIVIVIAIAMASVNAFAAKYAVVVCNAIEVANHSDGANDDTSGNFCDLKCTHYKSVQYVDFIGCDVETIHIDG